MIINSGWLLAPIYLGRQEGRPTFAEKRVRVEIDLDDCSVVSRESALNLLNYAGVSTRRVVVYASRHTRPLTYGLGHRLGVILEWPMPAAAFVQVRLEEAARIYFSAIADNRWWPKRDAETIERFRRHLAAAADLLEVSVHFNPFNRQVAPVLRGLLHAQSDDLWRQGEKLLVPLARAKRHRRKSGVAWYYADAACLREALTLVTRYADAAAKSAREEAQKGRPAEWKNVGNISLNDYVGRVCRLWRDGLGLPISTSVTNGKAGGPLVRFARGAMATIGVNKTDDATRGLIRRAMKAETNSAERIINTMAKSEE